MVNIICNSRYDTWHAFTNVGSSDLYHGQSAAKFIAVGYRTYMRVYCSPASHTREDKDSLEVC